MPRGRVFVALFTDVKRIAQMGLHDVLHRAFEAIRIGSRVRVVLQDVLGRKFALRTNVLRVRSFAR